MSDRAVRVVTEIAAVGRGFDYLVANGAPGDIGDRVRVNLHGRSVRGWIVGPGEMDRELKPVSKWLGLGPPPEMIELAQWCATRWCGPLARFLDAASPPRIVTALPIAPSAPPIRRTQDDVVPPGVVRLAPATDPLSLVLGAYEMTRAQPGSLVVLVPNEGWAERLTDRLRRRGLAVAGAHEWERARAGWPVVVGARGGAFAPVPRVAGAIVIDADDESYRSSAAPTWRAPDVLVHRASASGAPWWVTSPLPSPWLASLGPGSVAPNEQQMWPDVEVLDRRRSDPHEGVLSERAIISAHEALSSDEPVALCVVLQRLGKGRLIACRNCGELARCQTCGRAESELDGMLICASHGPARERFCRSCSSTKLRTLRSGVSTLSRDVSAQLGRDVTEITSHSAASGPLHRVVVGTEAVFTRVRRARLVVFVDIDQYLLAPRERGRRDAVLAVARAGRMVGGRSEARGKVLVQTRRGDDPVLRALSTANFDELVAQEDHDARLLGHAPYRAHGELSGPGAAALVPALIKLGVSVDGVDERVSVSSSDVDTLTSALALVDRPTEALRVAIE